jgi:hypothetical protein
MFKFLYRTYSATSASKQIYNYLGMNLGSELFRIVYSFGSYFQEESSEQLSIADQNAAIVQISIRNKYDS